MSVERPSTTGGGERDRASGDIAALSEIVAATAALADRARSQAACTLLLRAHALLRDRACARVDGAGLGPGEFTPS